MLPRRYPAIVNSSPPHSFQAGCRGFESRLPLHERSRSTSDAGAGEAVPEPSESRQ